jgi:hypothetical protein
VHFGKKGISLPELQGKFRKMAKKGAGHFNNTHHQAPPHEKEIHFAIRIL